jgi:FlaG/FlaF family flagellin (archaellin)
MSDSQTTTIIVAIIAALGAIIAAVTPTIIARTKKGTPPKIPTILLSGVVGLIVGVVAGLLVAFLLKPVDPCSKAKLDSPQGTSQRKSAAAYIVSNDVKISWVTSDATVRCVMTVQYYQNNQLIKTYENVLSGDTINIGTPNSGETEIKAWIPDTEIIVDDIWVWIK